MHYVDVFFPLAQGIALPLVIPNFLFALLLILIAFLIYLCWTFRRSPDPNLHIVSEDPIPHLVPSITGLSYGTLLPGNSIEIFQNGAFFDQLLDAISRAQQSVHFETFLWKEGRLGTRVADALIERSKAGVSVRVILDANGSKDMGEETERRLKESDCQFVKYHKTRIRKLGLINNRDHRKLVVIDGREAYVGGHCIVDTWLGEAEDHKHFRDLSVRVNGPAVHNLQSTFAENWIEATGELFVGDGVFPSLGQEGKSEVHVARLRPEGAASGVKILHRLIICCAKERIRIQNPYFLPEEETITALGNAVERGVDVRVMVPSTKASDMPIVQMAAHHNFERLLDAGVRLFEYDKTLLHQKVMTVDGCWSAVGSSNFDDRSFEINDEVTLGVHDHDLAARFEAIFDSDLEYCKERTSEEWARRGTWPRIRSRALYVFKDQL